MNEKMCAHGEERCYCEKCYWSSSGSELRFRNQAEEDAWYAYLYREHGGVKIWAG